MAKVTLQSIADRVGVSRMTVSNAFSRPDQLSAELRERILAAADELGYVGPDPAARALARGRTGSVGLLLTDSSARRSRTPVATEFLTAVSDALASEGLALTLLTRRDADDAVRLRAGPGRRRWTARSSTSATRPRPTSPGWSAAALPRGRGRPRPGPTASQRERRRPGRRPRGRPAPRRPRSHAGRHRHAASTFDVDGRRDRQPPARERMLGWRTALDAAGIEPLVGPRRFRPAHVGTTRRARDAGPAGPPDRGALLLRRVRGLASSGWPPSPRAPGARGPVGGRLRRLAARHRPSGRS